uniref:Ubiquitin-like protein ATG12 n=1 Tax=Strigamia maritima TaxID=126957 RepID=T1J1U3_STRMM
MFDSAVAVRGSVGKMREDEESDDNTTEGDETPGQPAENQPAAISEPTLAPMSPKPGQNKQKIDIFLKPTGSAPIMKQKKWSVEPEKKIYWVLNFIRRYLKLDANTPLFIYVNQAFAPSPDQTLQNLYDVSELFGIFQSN